MDLVIVESPAKSKTIEKYLGSNYKVKASMGHIRNLANKGKYGLGIDIENDFKPTYEVLKDKNKVIKELKKDVKESSYVYLATDPDREGEAISWHLKETLGLKNNYSRIEFNEITKNVVLDALKNPRDIDFNLVKSQETRMMLDKIIGFRLSRLMQSKTEGKSAGRVQSVALKLIVDRDREIKAFKKEEYWTVEASFNDFTSELSKYCGNKITIQSKEMVDKIIGELNKKYQVVDIIKKEVENLSKPVFKTSTLQQVASNKINFSAKKTMSVAQKLYEGINIGSETTGLITYMRTDSERMSPSFVNDTFKYIEKTYGKEYVGIMRNVKKNDNVQDAHEGIRPTDINRSPEKIKEYLTQDEYKLYSLIYKRALASLMRASKSLATTIVLNNNNYEFRASGSIITFDGYLKVYDLEEKDDKMLPNVSLNEELTVDKVVGKQHFTEPPSSYSEASLIKEMESLGIGRPSTYATIVSTIKERGYVTLDKKKFVPTDLGIDINDKLQEYFANIINVKYTANMENDLDLIASGKEDNVKTLKNFYQEFEPLVNNAFSSMEKTQAKETGEMCPKCGSPMVIRKGRYGEFAACSNYPECKYIAKEEKEELVALMPCPKCDGHIVEKKTRRGKIFYGCDRFPKCKVALWDKPTGEKCPKCGELMVFHDNFIKCSACDYVKESLS